jgi:hypothetical protein
MSAIENKQFQSTGTEPSIVDDLLTVMDTESKEARISKERQEIVKRFQAGEINRTEYNALIQVGAAFGESSEQILQHEKQAALDRINGDDKSQRFGHRVVNLLRRK